MKVIGITGTIACGKETVKDFLQKKFDSYYVTLSSIIQAEAEKKIKNFSRKTLQDLGNEMRKKYGAHILAKLAVDYLQKDKQMIIIDGIRNPREAGWLKKTFGKNFSLIAVDAPQEVRWQRLQQRAKPTDPKTFEEFVELDGRDHGKDEPEYGQQVKKCLELADAVIQNDGDMQSLQQKLNEVAQRLT